MAINFEGWVYFYKFSYERGFGGGSIPEMFGKLGFEFQISKTLFYLLNCAIFGLVVYVLFKVKKPQSIVPGSFFVLFAFTFFNKQYSMQYVIWLASLAVIALAQLSQKRQLSMLYFYVIWQASELAFQYSFFQNILTNINANSATPASPAISGQTYGTIGVVRYFLAITFTALLAKYLYDEKKIDSQGK